MDQILNSMSGWPLAAILAGLAGYNLSKGIAGPGLRRRVDFFLHAFMSMSMAAMALGVGWPVLPQLLLFALATHWFLIQAVSRFVQPPRPRGHALMCFYNASAMAGAGLAILPLGPLSTSGFVRFQNHHHSAPGPLETVLPEGTYEVAAAFFVAATIAFSISAVRGALRSKQRSIYGPPRRGGYRHSLAEAFSAAAMAIMLTQMS